MKFHARVVNHNHEVSSHILEAADITNAEAQMNAEGLMILDLKEHRQTFSFNGLSLRGNSQSALLASFNTELLTLLRAGLSLIESLEIIIEREKDSFRISIYSKLIKDIEQGLRFSSALEKQSQVFTPLYVGLVRSAEQTSQLQNAFEQFADFTQRSLAFRQKITSAMIYPTILMTVGSGVIFFLMFYVVPRFSEVYKDTGRPLPWLSYLLLSWGQLFQQHGKFALISFICILIGFCIFLAKTGASPFIRGLKAIPLFNQKIQMMEYSRVYLTLSMLLQGGIPIVEALTMLSEAVSSETEKKLRQASVLISQGVTVSSAFETQKLTNIVSIRLLRVGEKSGQLTAMLKEAGKLQEREVTIWIERFSKAFEPILMTLIGLIVGVIVVLLYMPIFDLAGSVQ